MCYSQSIKFGRYFFLTLEVTTTLNGWIGSLFTFSSPAEHYIEAGWKEPV